MISWRESTTAASSGYTEHSFLDLPESYPNYQTTVANYSQTVIDQSFTWIGYSDSDATATQTFAFRWQGTTVIGTTNSSFVSADNSPAVGINGQALSRTTYSTRLSTRAASSSTTITVQSQYANSTTTSSSAAIWTTSTSNSSASPVFYSLSQSTTSLTSFAATRQKTQDTTTTTGTEIHYGIDNTIHQCNTSDADAEIGWTATNVRTAFSPAASAFSAIAQSATRWTEHPNSQTVPVTRASVSVYPYQTPPDDAALSFGAVSEVVSFTTTITSQSTSQSLAEERKFPLSIESATYDGTTTTASQFATTYVPPTTISTFGGGNFLDEDNDFAFIYTTETVASIVNSVSRWTTGNGIVTWHQTAFAPTQVTVTRRSSVFDDVGLSYTVENAEIIQTMQRLGLMQKVDVSQQTALQLGAYQESSIGGFASINLAATFTVNEDFTALQSRQLATLMPSEYEIEASGFSGALRISGKSASATFVPSQSGSQTTTSSEFAIVGSAQTVTLGGRASLLGGSPGQYETFYNVWPFGVFADQNGQTSSFTPSVFSNTQQAETSWFQPIHGAIGSTATSAGGIVSFTTTRNMTALPPDTPFD